MTRKITQINAAILATPSPAFHAIINSYLRQMNNSKMNVYLNQINRSIINVYRIFFYLKRIKFSQCSSMQRIIEFK